MAAGARGRPGTTRRGRGLSLDRIVDETLALIDEEGMAAASMRGVAARLRVEPMSLYSHVASRDELFDAVVERVVNELSDDPEVDLHPGEGWRDWLAAMAHGVRRYARRHPHAFPLVATRPSQAPWVNPPLRSLRWIEAFLHGLRSEGFTDEQTLFAYRTFNSFLLGFLLLETSALTVRDPLPGDGSFTAGASDATGDGQREAAAESTTPVPGGLTPTRSPDEREQIDQASSPKERIDPLGEVDQARYPTVHDLAEGLAEDLYEVEFDGALHSMLDRIAVLLEQS